MDEDKASQAKIERPHARFGQPQEVVIDPTLSRVQKAEVLDALEQDARQLSVASDEGMAGGELNKLHDVLSAKDALELGPTDFAYDVVLKDLRAQLKTDVAGAARQAVEQALAALDHLDVAAARMAVASAPDLRTGGEPILGSAAEIDREIGLEKLDP